MESKLALGAHDIDQVDGNVTLRFTDGTERFVPIGQSEAVPNNPHEYSYCDDANDVLCRLEIRQVEKTKVDEHTKNVFYMQFTFIHNIILQNLQNCFSSY